MDHLDIAIQELNHLSDLADGLERYFRKQLYNQDKIVSVAAAVILLSNASIKEDDCDRLIELADSAIVRLRTFEYFLSTGRPHLAQRLTSLPDPMSGVLNKDWFRASYHADHQTLQELELNEFYRTGNMEHLERSVQGAEMSGGYRTALPLLVSATLADPKNSQWPFRILLLANAAGRKELVETVCTILEKVDIYPNLTRLFRSVLESASGQFDQALILSNMVEDSKIPRAAQNYLRESQINLFEKKGDYINSYKKMCEMKAMMRTPSYREGSFIKHVQERLGVHYEMVTRNPDEFETIHLLGFPRSGTTLLENMLNSHPEIETFEEITSLQAVRAVIDRRLNSSGVITHDVIEEARHVYQEEVIRRKKSDAKVLIDKMPIASAQARMLKAIFPGKKYIFSIRHPRDVVLSCFKQAFSPNLAMDSFTSFNDACRTYDFVMSQWFEAFTMDDPNVCYVRYDDLVMNMKPTMQTVFDFLNVDWDDRVNSFAKNAEDRANKTPSYAKVRQGLGIGVQSSWKNYKFLFDAPEARPLDKWVEFFGYA